MNKNIEQFFKEQKLFFFEILPLTIIGALLTLLVSASGYGPSIGFVKEVLTTGTYVFCVYIFYAVGKAVHLISNHDFCKEENNDE